MNITYEILSFIGGCLFYSFRGAVGKFLLGIIIKFAKQFFLLSDRQIKIYKHQRAVTIKAKRLASARAVSKDV